MHRSNAVAIGHNVVTCVPETPLSCRVIGWVADLTTSCWFRRARLFDTAVKFFRLLSASLRRTPIRKLYHGAVLLYSFCFATDRTDNALSRVDWAAYCVVSRERVFFFRKPCRVLPSSFLLAECWLLIVDCAMTSVMLILPPRGATMLVRWDDPHGHGPAHSQYFDFFARFCPK